MPTATSPTAVASPHARGRLAAVAMATPLLGSTLGIDGGDIFQMLAVENLGLDARTIGIGLGFCVLSVPVQLWAARLRLDRARRRLQAFLVVDAVLCWTLALLVVTVEPGSGLAASALALAVAAEIGLSVLYATAWQPLLALVLGARDRQRINGQARAVARSLLGVLLLAFGLANETTRVVFVVAVGFGALALARVVGAVPVPEVPEPEPAPSSTGRRRRLPPGAWALCITAGISTMAAWPLFVTYTHDVLWPDVNLGLVATAQLAGHVVAGLRWRTTETGLAVRARRAALATVGAAVLLAAIRAPVEGAVEVGLTLLAITGAAIAIGTFMLCTVERFHQTIDHGSSVRALTIFDVVASTSFQAGLFLAGLLVSASVTSTWPVDPYRLYLLTATVVLVAVAWRPVGGPGR